MTYEPVHPDAELWIDESSFSMAVAMRLTPATDEPEFNPNRTYPCVRFTSDYGVHAQLDLINAIVRDNGKVMTWRSPDRSEFFVWRIA